MRKAASNDVAFRFMRPYYYALHEYNMETFGRKLYKLSLQGGTTCPNRDGSKGTGGCIFCAADGSGAFTPDGTLSVTEQLEKAVERVSRKMQIQKDEPQFIAYFQSFTSTYAPVEHLRRQFTQAICWPGTAVLDVATRPDCLPPEVIELLETLRRQKPVWVELGLQTAHEATARVIHRCYENAVYEKAVQALHAVGIPVITHVILGLPGETKADMLRTVEYLNRVGTDGVKFQLLHVLRGTALAEMDYTPLTLEEYTDILLDCIEHLEPQIVVHRITGDGDKRLLLAPLWSGDKKKVLNEIHKAMRVRDIRQGKRCGKK